MLFELQKKGGGVRFKERFVRWLLRGELNGDVAVDVLYSHRSMWYQDAYEFLRSVERPPKGASLGELVNLAYRNSDLMLRCELVPGRWEDLLNKENVLFKRLKGEE